jgi:hypothetical protein
MMPAAWDGVGAVRLDTARPCVAAAFDQAQWSHDLDLMST